MSDSKLVWVGAETVDSISTSSAPPASGRKIVSRGKRPKHIQENRKNQRNQPIPGIEEIGLNRERHDSIVNSEPVRNLSRSSISPSQLRIMGIDPGPAEQNQLLSTFLHVKYPSYAAKADLEVRGSVFLTLPDVRFPKYPIYRYALSMFLYGHLGTHYKDQQLIYRARESYGRTLYLLARYLGAKQHQRDRQTILTAMSLLALSSDEVVPKNDTEWHMHYTAGLTYMKTHGPSCFDHSDPWDTELFRILTMPLVFSSLSQRRAAALTAPETVACGKFKSASTSLNFRMIRQGIRLSPLIEKVETYCTSNPSATKVKLLWSALVDFHHSIHGWLKEDAMIGRELAREEADVVHVNDEEAFDMEIEEHCFIASSSTFKSFFKFASGFPESGAPQGIYFTTWWFYGIIVDCALLRLLHYHNWLREGSPALTEDNVKESAFSHATQLCRSLYLYSKLSGQGHIHYIDIMRGLAQNFFQEIGAMKELGWCQALGVATAARRFRIMSSQSRSLCQLDRYHDGVIALSRFRAPPLLDCH